MPRMKFETALLLAPLAYAIHHIEEHIVFNFRAWRLKYFPDNNHLSTEAVLAILMAITMVYLLLHAIRKTRTSAAMAVLFLMATQVHNALYHLGGTLLFRDFSPGLVTAIVLYAPVNVLVVRAALQDGWINMRQVALLFIGGGVLFWSFEFLGPPVLLLTTGATWLAIIVSGRNNSTQKGGRPGSETTT